MVEHSLTWIVLLRPVIGFTVAADWQMNQICVLLGCRIHVGSLCLASLRLVLVPYNEDDSILPRARRARLFLDHDLLLVKLLGAI